ncbi:Voltage-dependent calcium channel type D subunit alpha-1 [Gossypium australe]|uniref:Voltage-dependent calcium channel type D subunit alpha-1 n=1 Tax=Gossypium australe TaxID=47621 RepID=A0A5B6WQT6_9ROSI|nr:Voltage-dependent calcium channel type D subunit alpha-1 [Gossypium australe]
MEESACLVRSFSNPADISREVKELFCFTYSCFGRWGYGENGFSLEIWIKKLGLLMAVSFRKLMVDFESQGNPIRALTESISFGRFMSEPLAWEKWSTFSHNRYLEEVEKFSKPGSVAQKKAFFEAHYKRRAAMRAAALLEQANVVTNDASQMGTINAASVDPLSHADLANSDASLSADQPEKNVSNAEIINTAGVDAGNLSVRENIDITDAELGPAVMEEDVKMEKRDQVANSEAFENGDIHSKIMTTPKILLKDCADPKNSTSSSKKRRKNSSSKSSVPSRTSKLPLHPSKRMASAQAKSDANVTKSAGNSNDKKKTILNSLHMSINVASSAGKTNKTSLRMLRDSSTPTQTPTRALKKSADQENLAPSSEKRHSNSTSKLSIRGIVPKQTTSRIGNNHAHINKKPALDPNEQRRIAQKSLHMSMNFTLHAGETNKTLPKISRESSTPLEAPTRASVYGVLKHASKVVQARDRRTTSVLNKSVSATGDGRWPSLSSCSKSSNASGTSTRCTINSAPFSFRSEERAAKRKEASLTITFPHALIAIVSNCTKLSVSLLAPCQFFKKLEDKMISKEAEKSQMLKKSKEKAKNELNKLRQSTDVKPRSNEDSCHGSQFSSNYVKKITSNWPQSPKSGRKPSPSTVQDANSRHPRRPSIKAESSKNGSMINNRTTCSRTSLPKNRHENASPNIQLSVGKRSISYKHENGGSVHGGGCDR